MSNIIDSQDAIATELRELWNRNRCSPGSVFEELLNVCGRQRGRSAAHPCLKHDRRLTLRMCQVWRLQITGSGAQGLQVQVSHQHQLVTAAAAHTMRCMHALQPKQLLPQLVVSPVSQLASGSMYAPCCCCQTKLSVLQSLPLTLPRRSSTPCRVVIHTLITKQYLQLLQRVRNLCASACQPTHSHTSGMHAAHVQVCKHCTIHAALCSRTTSLEPVQHDAQPTRHERQSSTTAG
jgi:hypothetical protein